MWIQKSPQFSLFTDNGLRSVSKIFESTKNKFLGMPKFYRVPFPFTAIDNTRNDQKYIRSQ